MNTWAVLDPDLGRVTFCCSVFCPCLSVLVGHDHHSAKKPPLSLKSFEIMQNGIICLNFG
jgi:hypothetical protein